MNCKSGLAFIFSSIILVSFYIEPRIASICNYGEYFAGDYCQDCGMSSVSSSFRIVGGVEAVPNSIPSMAYIKTPTGSCGGVIITVRTIMTAAHCVFGEAPDNVKVYVGAHNLKNLNGYLSAFRIRIHESYNQNTLANDIALIHLAYGASASSTVGMACLPQGLPTTYPPVGSDVIAAGWGKTSSYSGLSDVLQYVTVKVLDANAYCKRVYDPYNTNDFNTNSQICAGYLQGGKDSCEGDSGGPLIKIENINGKIKQVVAGIISYGAGCGNPGLPGVYTRVSAYLGWIDSNIQY